MPSVSSVTVDELIMRLKKLVDQEKKIRNAQRKKYQEAEEEKNATEMLSSLATSTSMHRSASSETPEYDLSSAAAAAVASVSHSSSRVENGEDVKSCLPLLTSLTLSSSSLLPMRVIVMGVDASEYSREAVQWARHRMYVGPNDIIVLVTVWEEAMMHHIATAEMGHTSALMQLQHSEIRQHNEEALKTARKTLKEFYHFYLPDCDVFPLIVSSSSTSKSAIGDVLCRTAELIEADAIVVGSHGHGPFKRFFLGSVSKYVVDHSQCPVLVVKK